MIIVVCYTLTQLLMHANFAKLRTLPETMSVGSKWTSDEESRLLESIANGKEIPEIAVEHKRTRGGIKSRLDLMAVRMIETDGKSIKEVSESLRMDDARIANAQKRFGFSANTQQKANSETELDILKEIRAILLRMEASM